MKKSTRTIVLIAFVIYCISLVYFFFLEARSINSFDWSFWEHLKYSTNLVPFKNIAEYVGKINSGTMNTSTIVANLLGNLVVLLPMGFFIPSIFSKVRSLPKFVLTICGIVFFVEVLQVIFRIGFFDIDSFILRIAGAMVGYSIWKITPIKKVFTI